MERFFEALEENADWLQTVHPTAWLAEHPPIGRAYVPTGSYAEMGEWSLPPDESRSYSAALHHATDEDLPERRWLRGGFWRNFQVKYREINDLHKQMLRTSAKVDAMPDGAAKSRALDHLYRGQSNDCYWHGLFGGIYISHMRLATFEHLIAAEDLADSAAAVGPRARPSTPISTGSTRHSSPGTGRRSWSTSPRAARSAAGTSGPRVMRWLRWCDAVPKRPATLLQHAAVATAAAPSGTTSIHELIRVKEPGWPTSSTTTPTSGARDTSGSSSPRQRRPRGPTRARSSWVTS